MAESVQNGLWHPLTSALNKARGGYYPHLGLILAQYLYTVVTTQLNATV